MHSVMRHGDAIELLAEYATGQLPEAISASVELHVRGCRACGYWLDTHRLLVSVLCTEPDPRRDDHPSSEVLALCVTRPEEVDELDRTDLMAHLASCPRCREEISIVREAVIVARPGAAEGAGPLSDPIRRADTNTVRSRWLLVAAACVFGAIVSGAVLFDWGGPAALSERSPGLRSGSSSTSTETRVENLQIEGRQIIRGEKTLLVSQVQVKPGAHVTFSAGEAVQFGAGFRISDGGSIAVEVTGTKPANRRL